MNDERQIRYFEMQMERNPERRFWLPIADLYRRRSRFEEARRLLEDGLQRHPESMAARWVLAQVMLEIGEKSEGVRLIDDVLVSDPNHAEAAGLLAFSQETTPLTAPEQEPAPLVDLEVEDELSPIDLDEITLPVEAELPEPEPIQIPSKAAEAAVEPAEDPEPEPESGKDVFVTRTLADIYLAQGHRDKALQILHRIVTVHPEREDVLEQITGLETAGAVSKPKNPLGETEIPLEREQDNRQRFETWLEREQGKGDPS